MLILVSAVTVYVSISAFSSLFCVPVGVTRSAVGMTLCEITTAIKNHQSIIKKKKKKYDEIVFFWKTKLNTIKVIILKL